jgi:hypothetical protein
VDTFYLNFLIGNIKQLVIMSVSNILGCTIFKREICLFLFVGCISILSYSTISAQKETEEEASGTHSAKYTNLNVPSVPAFILLDVTAAKVQQAGYTRSVKIDWTMKNYKNTPNVGLELQPLWLLYYNQSDLSRYRKASPLARN